MGLAAKTMDWTPHLQANTVTERVGLSIFFLGRRVIKSHRFEVSRSKLWQVANQLPLLVQAFSQLP
jgi:hypothetical protein